MSTDVMFDANVLSLYLFLWQHWEMIFGLLFNKFLSRLSNISSFSVRHKLQRYEVGLYNLYIPFDFQDISGFSCFIFKLQYSVDSLVSCLSMYNGTLNDFLQLL